MCGIAGVFHLKNSKTVKESEILKMRDTMVHRGPDNCGFYLSPDKKVGLGHRRLSIIDLSPAASQPMKNEDGTIWISYNGEIYNFRELRKNLKEKGHHFRSESDTEVIIHAYEEYGFDCVKYFNGMFSFAIWDEKKELLFASRDHLGIKPFYYAFEDGSFYFGSEIKAILAHPDFKKELDEKGIYYYLTFSSLPAPYTMFKNIKKLLPAHYLIIKKNGDVSEKEYWNPATEKSEPRSESFYISEVRRLLRDSIKSQMVSDVPFGCFLSGGVDSSTNAALMTEFLGKPVETFSIGSKDFEKYNEFRYSRKMSDILGSKTHELLLTENHLHEFLSEFPYYADDLNGDQVCLPLFWLAKLAKDNGVTMIQIGEGADEIFAGYEIYKKVADIYRRWWRWLEKFPDSMKRGIYKTSLFSNHQRFDIHKEHLRRLTSNQEFFWGYAIAFSDYQKEKLMTPEFKKRISPPYSYDIVSQYYKEIKNFDDSSQEDFLKRLTYLEIKNRLPEVLLMRADKMTMAHSVEGRVPFLDHRLVELAFQIPEGLKLKKGIPKYILKKAVEGIIPSEIIWRKKQGFASPISEWLKKPSTSKYLINIIRNSKIKERNFFNYDYVEKIIYAHQKQGVEHNFRIWNLITLSLWYDYWFK